MLLFFWRIIGTSEDLYGSDAYLYFIPLKQFIYDSLHEGGRLPFWNPYTFSGIPLITNIQASMFYPFGVLYYLLPPDSAYTWSAILHCVIGGLSMFTLMRSLALSIPAALLSAIVFCFNGFFLGHLYAGHLTFVQTYVWVPLVFLFVHRFSVYYRAADISAAGVILGIQVLGGFPQLTFYTVLLVLAYGGYRGAGLLWRREFRNAARFVMGVGGILLIGGGLAALQLLPTWEFAGLSTRAGGVSYAFATYDSLHPKELLSFLIPDLYGSAVDKTYWRSREAWHFWETGGYVGLLPLFLVFFRRQKDTGTRLTGFFVVLILVALFLALGKYNPLYPWIAQLPGFRSFRIPAQIIFLYVFGMSVLAGFGLDRMRKGDMRLHPACTLLWIPLGVILVLALVGLEMFPYEFFSHLFRFFAMGSVSHANLDALLERTWGGVFRGIILFAACLAILAARKSRRLSWSNASALAVFLAVVDLFLFGNEFIQPYRYDAPTGKAALVARLPRNPTEGRVMTLQGSLTANDSIRHRFPSILGYDPLLLRRYVYGIQESQGWARDDHVVSLQGVVHRPEERLMQLLHLKWVVAGERIMPLKNNIPYAMFVGEPVLRSGEDALQEIRREAFDPTRSVVLESKEKAFPAPGTIPGSMQGRFAVRSYENERIQLRVSVDRPAYMVLSEIHYPGWRAKVDGDQAPVLVGNYLFRVVPLQAGDHEVELTFVSWPFRIGAGISLATLLTVGGVFLSGRRRRQAEVG